MLSDATVCNAELGAQPAAGVRGVLAGAQARAAGLWGGAGRGGGFGGGGGEALQECAGDKAGRETFGSPRPRSELN